MIEFTLADGNAFTVNVAALASFQPPDDDTLIYSSTGRCETVQEPCVAQMFDPKAQAVEPC